MIELLSGIELLNAASLFSALALPLLVLAYLKRKQSKKRIVSSLLVLKKLRRKRSVQTSFKPPLRFFIELLLLILLMLAAALPVLTDGAEVEVIVLDTSLSMKAKSANGGETRLEQAKKLVDEILSDASLGSTFTLYQTSPRFELVGQKGLSASALRQELSSLRASGDADSLGPLARELAEQGTGGRIHLLSDQVLESFSADEASVIRRKENTIPLLYHPVGEPEENVFISSFKLERSTLDTSSISLTAALSFSGRSSIKVDAELYALSSTGASKLLQSFKDILIEPDLDSRVEFQVSEPSEIFKLQVHPRGQDASRRNSIIEDDFAWVSSKKGGGTEVLLVRPDQGQVIDQEANTLGLERLPNLEITSISASRYQEFSQQELSKKQLIIFYKTAPTTLVQTSMMLILPPDDNPLFPVSKTVTSPRISSWASEHIATSYLNVPSLVPQESLVFELPPWATSVINVEQGPALLVGESGGHRFAAIGFEILPFEGAKTPSSSILLLNLLSWLSSDTEHLFGPSVGSQYRLYGEAEWLIRGPERTTETFKLSSGETKYYTFNSAGPYFLQKTQRAADPERENKELQRTRFVLAVNNLFSEESNTFLREIASLPTALVSKRIERSEDGDLWWYLVIGALALLLLEFSLRLRRAEEVRE